MSMKTLCMVMVGAMVILVCSCKPKPVTLGQNFGASVKIAIESQILNPEAQLNLHPVEGMDGKAAVILIEDYRKGFDSEKRGDDPVKIKIQSLK